MSSTAPTEKAGIFARLALFVRQVLAELHKVVWPTRPQLVNYTIVVLLFVVFMAVVVGVMDYVFTQGVLFLFG